MINIAIKNNSSFPLTPTVLWDHKPAGPSEWIHILQFRYEYKGILLIFVVHYVNNIFEGDQVMITLK